MQVGEYQILEELARTAESTVYRAHAPRLGREVALKLAHQNSDAARIARQAEGLRAVAHRYVVQVHDVGEFQGRAFLVLDLVQGPTLAQRIVERGPLRPGQAGELVRQLAEAVAHAHERGVIHGALRPERVLLSGGEPRLTGFRERGSSESDAPEDVFGLGAILRAALTGKVGETPSGESLLNEIEPADMGVLTRRCLSEDAAQRPTAQELVEALAGLLEFSGERGWSERTGRPGLVKALAAGLVALLLVAVVLITILIRRGGTESTPSEVAPVGAPKVGVAPVPSSAPPPAATPLQRAEAHRQAGRLREAIALLDQVVAQAPDDAAGYAARGRVQLQSGALEEARVDLRRALSITPKAREARRALSDALLRGERWEDARLQLDVVLRADPQDAVAWRWWGRASLELGRWGDALHGYTRARELAPQDPWCEAELGRLYGRVGRHDLALKAFETSLATSDDPALVRLSICAALRAGELAVAGRELARPRGEALETLPGLGAAMQQGQNAILTAWSGWGPEERKAAIGTLRRLVARFPKAWAPSSVLGSLLLLGGELEQAQVAIRTAMERDPQAASVGQHAVALILVGRREAARDALLAAVRGPQGRRYVPALVGAAALAPKPAGTHKIAIDALARLPASASRTFALATAHTVLGQRAAAVAALRQGGLERLIPSLPQRAEQARIDRILELFVAAKLHAPYPTARLRETLKRYGGDPWVLIWASEVGRGRGQPASLRTALLSTTHELVPESQPVTIHLAASLADEEKPKPALEVATRGLKRFPKSGQLMLLQARAEFMLDRPERGVEVYRRGFEEFKHPIFANNLANYLVDAASTRAEALKLARYAVSKLPREGTLLETLAWALACAGQLDEALRVMKHAMDLGANSATAWAHYALILWQLGHQPEGRRALRVAELTLPRPGTLEINAREAKAAIARARERINGD